MANITSEISCREWAEDKGKAWQRAISIRAALRAVPAFADTEEQIDFALSLFRALILSWEQIKRPARNRPDYVGVADHSAYKAAEGLPRFGSGKAAMQAAAIAASAARDIAEDLDHKVGRVSGMSARAAGPFQKDVWTNVEQDASWLEEHAKDRSDVLTLLATPLWLVSEPKAMRRAWESLATVLRRRDESWNIWIDWYERRLEGQVSSFGLPSDIEEAFVSKIAFQADAFWEREPGLVNADIEAWLDEASPNPPPAIPSRQPASVKPVWHNDKLVQDDAVASTARPETLDAMLKAISADMLDFADDLANGAISGNVDYRAIAMLRKTSTQAGQARTKREDLFRLANRLLELQLYGPTVSAEWAPENGVRFHALALQLDNLLKTFPELREYVEAQPKPERSLDEAKVITEATAEALSALQTEHAQAVVDLSVTDALAQSQDSVTGDLGAWIGSTDPWRKRTLGSLENMLGGTGNTLGELADRALKSLRAEPGKHADKSGEYAAAAIAHVVEHLKKSAKAGAGGAAVALCATQFEVLSHASAQLGSLAVVLLYIYMSKTSSK